MATPEIRDFEKGMPLWIACFGFHDLSMEKVFPPCFFSISSHDITGLLDHGDPAQHGSEIG